MKKFSISHQGVILMIVLWLLFLISFLTIQYSKSVRQQAKLGINLKGKILGYYMAQSAVLYAQKALGISQELTEPTEEFDLWQPDGVFHPVDLGNGITLKVGVEAETEKLDLNAATSDQILNLLLALDIPEDIASVIADSIMDWRDEDKIVRVNGAEDEYYQEAGCNYTPANGPFRSLEELLLVRGISYELFWERPGLWHYFTIYNPEGKIEKGEKEEFIKLKNGVTYRFIVKGIVKNVYIFYISWQRWGRNKWQMLEERFY